MATFSYNFRVAFVDDGTGLLTNGTLGAYRDLTDGEAGDLLEQNEPVETDGLSGLLFLGTFQSTIDDVQVTFLVAQAPASMLLWIFGSVAGGVTLTAAVDAVAARTNGEYPFVPLDDASYVTCFASGTLIATPTGEVPVETLQIGDLVLATDGRPVPVLWLGWQTRHKAVTPAADYAPVRVQAGALSPGVPHRDLVLTPGHALIIDGIGINAGALVNGSTIAFVPMDDLPDTITYWHIETEAHEEILANGASAETFIDYADRMVFDNYATFAARFGSHRAIQEMPRPRISTRRQLPTHLAARFGIRPFAEDVDCDAAALADLLAAA